MRVLILNYEYPPLGGVDILAHAMNPRMVLNVNLCDRYGHPACK